MEKLLWKEKLSYGIGAYGKDFIYNMIAAFLMIFYTDVVGVSLIFVSTLFLVVRIVDAITNPFMGWLVDNTKTKWGKFRPWILIGTIINSFVLILLYLNPATFLQGILINVWCIVTYLLWSLTYTLMDVPFWAMIPAFSNDAKVRNEISMLSRLFATFGGQMMSTIGLLVIACLGVNMGASESDGYLRFAVIVAIVFNICEIICVRNVSEHVVIKNKRDIKLSEVLNFLKENDQLLIIIFMTILQQIAVFLWTGMNIYFFKYVVCHEEWFSIFGIVNFCSLINYLFLFASRLHIRAREINLRKFCGSSMSHLYLMLTIDFLLILLFSGLLGMFFVGDDHKASVVLFFSVASLFCLGNALAGVSTTVMLADTADYGEYKCGVRSEAIVFSVQTFTAKFGSAIAGFIGAMVLSLVGYVPNVMQTADTILGLRLMMFVASASLFIIILFIYLKFYKLNGSFYQNILDELVIMRKNNN